MMSVCVRIALRELKRFFGRKQFVILAVIVPVAYALFFTAVYWNKKVTEIPVTIVDQDNSALSRSITSALMATQTFSPGIYGGSVDEFRSQVIAGKSHVCFVFPHNFEKDVKSGKGAKVAAWVDASNILVGNVAITAASEVIGTYSVGIDIKKSKMRGTVPINLPLRVVQPIRDEYRIWYNPSFNHNYANFMLLGLVMISVQLLTLLFVALSGASEIERGSLPELKSISTSPAAVIVGKAAVYIAIMFPVCVIASHLPFFLLGVPMRGSELLLLGITLWFVAMLVVIGIGVSSLLKDSLKTTEVFAIIAMPSYLASGYTWPSLAMPAAMKLVSYALPLTPYVMSVRKITLLSASIRYLGPELISLGVWSCIAIILAYLGMWRLLRTREISPKEAP